MTYREIKQTIEAYNKKQKQTMQWEATLTYQGARLIAKNVGQLFKKSKDYSFEEAFPNMIDKDELSEARKKQQFKEYKKRRLEQIQQYNESFRK